VTNMYSERKSTINLYHSLKTNPTLQLSSGSVAQVGTQPSSSNESSRGHIDGGGPDRD
jgi:hypothetical protein